MVKSPFKKIFFKGVKTNPTKLMGLEFKNKIGLAAGFDKNADMLDWLSEVGFGFIEVGTITPKPQMGNPKPRLFRLPKDEALINRMGFNNKGVEYMVENLKKHKHKLIIGGNIGKNKHTPNDQAFEDYTTCFEALFNHVDYFCINVSSPNTKDLRALQDKEPLNHLLSHIQNLNHQKAQPKPILLKIAPDLNPQQIKEICEVVKTNNIQGIICSNTTIDRSNLSTPKSQIEYIGAGGLSGKPLISKSNEVLKRVRKYLPKPYTIIAVGGIHSVEDAQEKIALGADLLQVYTGFIYKGPGLIQELSKHV